jgi:hypothetical protein
MRDPDPGKLKLPRVAQTQIDVGDERRHGDVAEVDNTRASVLEDQPQRQNRVDGAGAEAKEQEENIGRHVTPNQPSHQGPSTL